MIVLLFNNVVDINFAKNVERERMVSMAIQIFMMIFLIIIFSLMIFPVEKRNDSGNVSFISKENTTIVKGISCIMVVLCHISVPMSSIASLITKNGGYLAVGIFFFCSGYGLFYSYQNKIDYLKNFWQNRILPVMILWWSANSIYVLVELFCYHHSMNAREIIFSITGVRLICGNHWFIQTLVILYIVFYFLGKYFTKLKYLLLFLTVFCIIYDIILLIQNNWWGGTTLPFLFGAWTAYKKQKILERISYNYKTVFAVISIPFFAATFYYCVLRWHLPFNKILYYSAGILSECLVACFCFLILIKIKIKSWFAKVIGTVSYEIYLLHQLCIKFFENLLGGGIKQIFVMPMILASSFIVGYIFHNVMKNIINHFKHKQTK